MGRLGNRSALVAGVLLFALAAITVWDALNMRIRATYGIGADTTAYAVAVFLGALSLAQFVAAFRRDTEERGPLDWAAVGWVVLALAGLVGAVAFNGGFILGSTLLFAFTARAFGRRALLIDLVIGASLGLAVYLLFHHLLTLNLPRGPIENLL